MEQLPQWAYNAALASLPLQTPLRLRRLIGLGDVGHVWEMLSNNERPLDGIPDDVWRAWHSCGEAHVQAVTEQCITAGVSVAKAIKWLESIKSSYPNMFCHWQLFSSDQISISRAV